MTESVAANDGRPVYRERRRVEWIETDAGGRIHFTAVFRWAESAEYSLLRQVGATRLTTFPRREVSARYHRPLRFGDEFEIEITAGTVGTTSIVYEWRGTREGELYFEGTIACVNVDDDGRPSPLPDELRDALRGSAT
ncbi:acyl-CoA thioesterase [Parafrigoribacterium humi]|jgi:YbgC/YbaW family acyl-CoA thioester hydrolase|uniref:acyl-CoA thioesterase n=1 Tax=Parafrigoribacterium humi TaxID=3144664 RepID=UPI0032EF57FD